MDFEEDIESILYIAREISVYKIPPLKANEGHRANEWGNLSNPLWKGRLRIIETSKGVSLQFEDAQTGHPGELFARAEYHPTRPSVEAVLDSSRYFVVRVEDAGKKAYIGIGFAERTDSFDFSDVALQDYEKRYKANLEPPLTSSDSPSPHMPSGPKKDYSLKEGQTFSIAIPGRSKAASGGNLFGLETGASEITQTGGGGGGGGFPLLPPPPSASKRQ